MKRLLFILLSLLACAGCASISTQPDEGGAAAAITPRPPESIEQRAFSAMSSFYCTHKRWPRAWKEFVLEWQKGSEPSEWLSEFANASLSSSRAIVAELEYQTPAGVPKVVYFIAPPQCDGPIDPSQVSIAAGRVTFALPAGFKVMKGEQVKSRWRNPPFPDVAWEDPVSHVVIALRFGDVAVAPSDLASLKESLDEAYEGSVRGLSWLSRGVRVGDGPPRLVHYFESDSSRGRIATMALSFSFDGKLLGLNVVGPAEAKAAVEEVAVAVRSTLRLQ